MHVSRQTVWHEQNKGLDISQTWNFGLRNFSRLYDIELYSTEGAFSWAIDWRRLRYDIMNNGEVIHIIPRVISTYTYYI